MSSSRRPKRIPSRFRVCCDCHCDGKPWRNKHQDQVPRRSIKPLLSSSSFWGAKRARTVLPCRREWADLGDGPAGLIAERVLAYDVADYLRFRAVCRPWRRCSVDPRAHGCLDRRFHPRRWILLQEPPAPPSCRRRYLNTSTGECVVVDIPELRDHEPIAVTPEGLLVLVRGPQRTAVRILNPLTRHLAELPPFTTLLPSERHDIFCWCDFDRYPAWGCVVAANDDDSKSKVVLSLAWLRIVGVAKPGDECWTVLKLDHPNDRVKTSSIFAGRFYCVTGDGVMVLEDDQPPRLELAAKLPMQVSSMTDSAHLVECAGELMLVHRSRRFSRKRRYNAYRVDLDARTLCRVNRFGGGRHALFIGTTCSFSVPSKAFPSGSIRGDTIYLSFDVDGRYKTQGYNLANKRRISCSLDRRTGLAAGPHTLVDCLSLIV